MNKPLSIVSSLLIILILGALGYLYMQRDTQQIITVQTGCPDWNEASLRVADTRFRVAVAETRDERVKGLIGCAEVPDLSGEYFMYPQPDIVQYWMKGMSIPIDIIWVSGGVVVGFEPNIPPVSADTPTADIVRYTSPQPVDGVLEIGAGQAETRGIMVGTSVELRSK